MYISFIFNKLYLYTIKSVRFIYRFKVWSLCTYVTTNTIKKQNLSVLISFIIIEERSGQDQEESVAYDTHSSQEREYMSYHGRATRGITKGEVAKSVSKRGTVCPSLYCGFCRKHGWGGMTFTGYYRGRCRLWIGWFVFETTQIRLSGTRCVWHLHTGQMLKHQVYWI